MMRLQPNGRENILKETIQRHEAPTELTTLEIAGNETHRGALSSKPVLLRANVRRNA